MKDKMYEEVAKVAFELHEKRGWVHGYDLDDWLEAEQIVLDRYAKAAEKKAQKPSKSAKKK